MPINDPEKSENMRKSIRVYSGSSNRPLAQKIAEFLGVELSGLTLKQFANGEIYARYDETVRGADVFLIQSVAGGNVNDMLMELLIATDAAKRASAPREPITARLVANLLERAGVNRIITLDLHQGQIQGFFDIPVNHLSALPLFGQYYNDMHFDTDNLVVVSPDVGRAKAAKKLSDMLGSGPAIERLNDAPIVECLVTDAIPVEVGGKIKTISVAAESAQAISAVYHEEPVSTLVGGDFAL